MVQGAQDRHRGEPAHGTERGIGHEFAEVAQDSDVLLRLMACDDAVHGFDATGRADAARCAFAARFLGAEGEGETCLLGHIDSIVEHDEAAMAEHGADRGQRLVIHRGVEQIVRDIGAERATNLNGADRATAQGAAAETFDDVADGNTEIELGEAAALDVPRDLDGKGAERPVEAVGCIGSAAIGQNPRHA